jgi:hypothetical protein
MKKTTMKRQASQYKKFCATTTPMFEALFGEAKEATVSSHANSRTHPAPVEHDGVSASECFYLKMGT